MRENLNERVDVYLQNMYPTLRCYKSRQRKHHEQSILYNKRFFLFCLYLGPM